jgi:hypothetical protein
MKEGLDWIDNSEIPNQEHIAFKVVQEPIILGGNLQVETSTFFFPIYFLFLKISIFGWEKHILH